METTRAKENNRPADHGLVRHRSKIELNDDLGVVLHAVGQVEEAIREIQQTFQGDHRDIRIVLDVYATEHPDPLADGDHGLVEY